MAYPKRQIVDGKLRCSKCGEDKPVADYTRHKVSSSGYRSSCRSCDGNTTKIGRKPREVVDGKLQCVVCMEWTPLERMEKHKKCASGRGSRCHKCNVRKTNNRYISSLSAYIKVLVGRHNQNLKFRIKHRGKARSHLWTSTCVTFDYIQQMWERQQGRCAITGIEMTHVRGRGLDLRRNLSIDRIRSEDGYEDGNIQLVCNAVNLMKHSMDMEQLNFWCRAILNRQR